MGIAGGPYIVRDSSLVLELDAADRNSYVSGSLVWNDLSGNTATSSLLNGPIFTTSSGGSIALDGVNDYIDSPINIAYSQGTISVWTYPKSNNNNNFFVYTAGQGSWTHMIYLNTSGSLTAYIFDGSQRSFTGSAIVDLNRWHNIVFWWSNSVGYGMYLNGTTQGSSGLGSAWASGNRVLFGNSMGGTAGGVIPVNLNGNIAVAQIYNRALSAAEVLQNYNALKSRFNL